MKETNKNRINIFYTKYKLCMEKIYKNEIRYLLRPLNHFLIVDFDFITLIELNESIYFFEY